jgi:RimJ/RimL family protein N-acetyltransferase
MTFELQPVLENELVKLLPLKTNDFEILYAIASDPLLWEQHPNKDRYKREVFENFFMGAIESGGAFMVFNARKGRPIGSSRFYDFNPEKKSVVIGYTFLARDHWGTSYNRALKLLMLEYAFKFVDQVLFYVGAVNTRSQKAMEKLGAVKISEEEVAYYGEPGKPNFVYRITRPDWETIKSLNGL